MKIAISQKCVQVFAPNFVHLFKTKLRLSVLLRAIFTLLTPIWRERKLQERIFKWTKSCFYL